MKQKKTQSIDIDRFASNYFNAYDYLQFNIGFPNTNKPKEKIAEEVQRYVDYLCKEKNISDKLKPSIIVIDSIQYAPVEIINDKLRKALPDKKFEGNIFASYKKQPKDMSQKEFIEFVSVCTKTPPEKIKEILELKSSNDKGFYSPFENTITYYTDSYRQGSESIITTIRHEFHHVEETIKRSSLSQKERDKIVKERLLVNIKEGEAREIFKQMPTEENLQSALMEAPVFNEQTRKLLADFAEKNLFTDSYDLYFKMQKYSELLAQKSPNEKELAAAKIDLNGLAEEIEELAKTEKIYDKSSLLHYVFGLKDPKVKNKIIFDYMMSVEFRYQVFREKEIEAVQEITTSNEFLKEIEKTFDYHIRSSLANYVMNIPGEKNKTIRDILYWNYYSSPEEVKARIISENDDIILLKNKINTIKDTESKKNVKRMKELLKEKEKQQKEDYELDAFYDLKGKINDDPRNIRLKIMYFIKERKIENIKSNHILAPFPKILIQTSLLTSSTMYKRNLDIFKNTKHPIQNLHKFYQQLPIRYRTGLFIPAGTLFSLAVFGIMKHIKESKDE